MSRELNLVPQVYNQIKVEKKKKRTAIVGILSLVILLLLGVASTFGYEGYLNYKHNSLTEEVAKNQELINKNEKLQQDIDRTRAHISKAQSLQILMSKKTDVLFDELEKNFPTAIKVDTINYNKKSIIINGITSNKDSIQELWANLRESAIFNKCHVSSITEDKNVYKFVLEITLIEEKTEGGTK